VSGDYRRIISAASNSHLAESPFLFRALLTEDGAERLELARS
jgi:hypothetical protein